MKKLSVITALFCIAAGFAFSFHVIRLEKGMAVIAKDHLTLRETWVDAGKFDPKMLVTASPRVRNYLLQVYGAEMLSELKKGTEKSAGSVKKTLREKEQSFHEWVSEKLK
ncbi:MAG: hypothetical protein R2941_24750 [Desulfobacterales bacterium]